MAYYNENDPKAAAWLRELVRRGLVEDGEVDERSIEEVQPGDVPDRAHFFAGIGGWPYALALAGWPADAPVWTGSCPCQPFSAAGRRGGADDARHLWPVWFRLIAERRPSTVFGEQVASNAGRRWLAGVRADLETLGYAVGAADLCAACVGSPHIRQRLFWVAHAEGAQRREEGRELQPGGAPERPRGAIADGRVADAAEPGRRQQGRAGETGAGPEAEQRPDRLRATGGLGNADQQGSQGRLLRTRDVGQEGRERHPRTAGAWDEYALIPCGDGKARRVEPGAAPLAPGFPRDLGGMRDALERLGVDAGTARRVLRNVRSRVAGAGQSRTTRLRGFGNAIVPQVAAAFVRAFMESVG